MNDCRLFGVRGDRPSVGDEEMPSHIQGQVDSLSHSQNAVLEEMWNDFSYKLRAIVFLFSRTFRLR